MDAFFGGVRVKVRRKIRRKEVNIRLVACRPPNSITRSGSRAGFTRRRRGYRYPYTHNNMSTCVCIACIRMAVDFCLDILWCWDQHVPFLVTAITHAADSISITIVQLKSQGVNALFIIFSYLFFFFLISLTCSGCRVNWLLFNLTTRVP